MSAKKTNRSQQQAGDQKLIDGLTKHAATIPFVVIGGTSLSTAALIAAMQARLAAASATVTTRATWLSAVKADADERAKTKTLVSGLRQAVQVAFGGSIDALADFGLKPRKQPATRTPEEKAAAVAKAQATRAARHTMGPQQKKGVKGAVTGVVVTPVSVAQPTGSSAPATSTGASAGGAPHP